MPSQRIGLHSLTLPGLLTMFAFTTSMADDTDGVQSPWRVVVGAGTMFVPEFPGSDSMEIRPIPAFSIAYDDRWFLNGDGLGVYLLRDERWSLATSIGADLTERDESDSAHLRGTGDVDQTIIARVRGAYQIGVFTVALGVTTDVANEGHGTVADAALQFRSQITTRLAVDYGVAVRWINNEYSATFFGVTPQQSLASGLSGYEAENGIGDARAFIDAVYGINDRWLIRAGTALGQLQGDAADSPIVEDDTFYQLDFGLMYRF